MAGRVVKSLANEILVDNVVGKPGAESAVKPLAHEIVDDVVGEPRSEKTVKPLAEGALLDKVVANREIRSIAEEILVDKVFGGSEAERVVKSIGEEILHKVFVDLSEEDLEFEHWDTRDMTCECFPDVEHVMTTSVPPIPMPPYPDPCCCYGLPEPFKKPGPNAFYLGMGYKAPNMKGPEYLRTPGWVPRQPGLGDYTTTHYGTSLLPPYTEGDLKQSAEMAEVFVITGEKGFQVEVTEYGARLMSIRAPDIDGIVNDVLLGFDSPEDYWRYKKLHWGGVTGRLADRVRGPRPHLQVPGVGWCLFPENEQRDHVMGGEKSLDRVVWDAHLLDNGVLFSYLSRAGDEDYPGNVVVSVTYRVEPVNRLVIHTEAMTTAPTPFALMQPLTFNLAGHNTGEIVLKEHVLTVNSEDYLPKIRGKIDAGYKRSVALTPYDLRVPRHLRKILRHAPKKSYDVLMCMAEPPPDDDGKQRLMAKLFHPTCRRVMEVWSDLPVLHLATNLGLTRRPPKPLDPILLDEARKIILEIIAKITKCEDLLPLRPTKVKDSEIIGKDMVDLALKDLYNKRPAPNPGDIRTIPKVNREESLAVVAEILEEILSRVKARPPCYTGFNSYRYWDDCGLMLYPRHYPLLADRYNLPELVLRPGQRYSHTVTYAFGVVPRPEVHKRRRFGRQRPFKRDSELMIDHCSAASSLELQRHSYTEIHDSCSDVSEPSI